MRGPSLLLFGIAGCISAPPGTPCNADSECGDQICDLGVCVDGARELSTEPVLEGEDRIVESACWQPIVSLRGDVIDDRWIVGASEGAHVRADGAIRTTLTGADSPFGAVRTVDAIPFENFEMTTTVVDVPSGASAAQASLELASDEGLLIVGINDATYTLISIDASTAGVFTDEIVTRTRANEKHLRLRAGAGFYALEAARGAGPYELVHRGRIGVTLGSFALGAFAEAPLENEAVAAFRDVSLRTGCGCRVRFDDEFDQLDPSSWIFSEATGVIGGGGRVQIGASEPNGNDLFGFLSSTSRFHFYGRRLEATVSTLDAANGGFVALFITDGSEYTGALFDAGAIAAALPDGTTSEGAPFALTPKTRIALEHLDDIMNVKIGAESSDLTTVATVRGAGFIGDASIALYAFAPAGGQASATIERVRLTSLACP